MVDTCEVTFTAHDSTFALLPGQTVVLVPTGAGVEADGASLIVRTKVTGIADGAGEVSLSARPGAYILTTLSDEGPVAVQIAVPDQATATIGDCLAAVSEIVYTTAELAVLAASGLLTYATTVAGLAATPSGRFFMTPAAPSGLSVWENVAGVATLRGALLDEQDLLDAATAATAADRLQTGLDAAAAALSSSAAVAAETAASGARDAALLSRGVFASTAAGLSQGVAAVTVTAGGASGANGVFALAFSGGAGTGARTAAIVFASSRWSRNTRWSSKNRAIIDMPNYIPNNFFFKGFFNVDSTKFT